MRANIPGLPFPVSRRQDVKNHIAGTEEIRTSSLLGPLMFVDVYPRVARSDRQKMLQNAPKPCVLCHTI